jgi:hypothetical protein
MAIERAPLSGLGEVARSRLPTGVVVAAIAMELVVVPMGLYGWNPAIGHWLSHHGQAVLAGTLGLWAQP